MPTARRWPRLSLLVLVVLSSAALVAGWNVFWFLCDDAYIAFRYAHNFLAGDGLVWNAAPFVPVEGYTSFLWVLLLSFVWAITGVEPPESANWLLLGFSFGSLWLLIRMGLALPLSPRLQRWRVPMLFLVVLGTLSNRTFLAWTSSGLEQGMFSFFLLAWVYVGLFRPFGRGQLFTLATLAALLELTRPDGLLFVAISAAIIGIALYYRLRLRLLEAGDLWLGLPFLVPLAHVVWRFSYYGEWLPNTYYAKHVSAWPEAGVRYAASFMLEYAYYLWIPLALVAAVRWSIRRSNEDAQISKPLRVSAALRSLCVLAVVLHFLYYTLIIGGDSFEYRVYHHLVPLLMLALPWLLDRCGMNASIAMPYAIVALLLGLVLPWSHWAQTHRLVGLHEAGLPYHRIAPRFPEVLRPWAIAFDHLQGWLIKQRGIGLRHQTHLLFTTHVQWQRFPSRRQGLALDLGDDEPVMLLRAVGYAGWVLPRVAIIDGLGLNDRVIARNPVSSPMRRMSHDRNPPAGYVECFRPNVFVDKGEVIVNEREHPLSDEEIRTCEERFMRLVRERLVPIF